MKLPAKSKDPLNDIEGFYKVNIRSLWSGLKNEHIAFWALCAYFFFEYVRPQSIYPVIDVVPWGQITLLLTLIAVFFDSTVKWTGSVENKLFVIFALIIILSGIFAFNPSVSWRDKDIMIGWFIVYFLIINIVNTEKRLFLFLLAFLLFSFKMSQHGFFTWAGRGFSFAKWGLIGAGGWFQNSGEFAIQMLIFGPMSAAFVFSLKDNWGRYKRWFFYFMPFTAIMSVMGASSRGAQLALAVIGVVLLIKVRAGLKVLIPLVLVSVTLFQFLPEEQKLRFTTIGQDDTSLHRLEYWKFGLEIMQDYPLLGVGYRNWMGYYWYAGDWEKVGWARESHNIFIQAGAELGYTGLVCLVMMILFVFILNSRSRKMAKNLGNRYLFYMTYGLDGGLIGYLVAGFFVTVLYYPFFWIQMAIVVALHAIARRQLAEKAEAEKEKAVTVQSEKFNLQSNLSRE